MEKKSGFFCVVYFKEEGKTVYFHKVWNPSKLASYYDKKWLWIKIFLHKEDYFSKQIPYKIFDKNNAVTNFNFNNKKDGDTSK